MVLSIPAALAELRGEAPTVLGDARQVGLSGASLAMPDSIHSAMENPANSTLEKWALSLSFQTDRVHDSRMNSDGAFREGEGKGILGSTPRFGLFLGHRLPSEETDGVSTVKVQETHFGAAYKLRPDFTLGLSLVSARADWSTDVDTHSSSWGVVTGATYIRDQTRYALSFRPGMPSTANLSNDPLTRVVELPWKLGFGVTHSLSSSLYIHATTFVIGGQNGANELAAPNRRVTSAASFQPRLGLEYHMIEDDPWSLSFYGGSYVEPGRLEGTSARAHYTAGAALGFLSARASVAIDRASSYKNTLLYVGVDVLDALVRTKIIPIPESMKNPEKPKRLEPLSDAVPREEP